MADAIIGGNGYVIHNTYQNAGIACCCQIYDTMFVIAAHPKVQRMPIHMHFPNELAASPNSNKLLVI